ncbi:unnamed protein product [Allacma fusca]|uniref:Uncharacterized protein n=1 Tax=Allacma fusca TaxID=39272 RepID=A0A8J2PM13_9HEXA|nr:unnamed protein product [Allacma fusca]
MLFFCLCLSHQPQGQGHLKFLHHLVLSSDLREVLFSVLIQPRINYSSDQKTSGESGAICHYWESDGSC